MGLILQVGIVFIPWTRNAFNIVCLNKTQWLYVFLVSTAPIVIMEAQKKLNEAIFGKTIYEFKKTKIQEVK